MKRFFLSLLGLLLASCSASPEPLLCDQIPENGCPTGRGGTCDDPVCEALYDCTEGVWVKTETCKGNATGGGGASTTSNGGSGGGTGGACTPIEFDHTGEKIGCEPDLQSPDCPVAAAEQCPESACLTDCSDFYICKDIDGMGITWQGVAYCDNDGKLHPTER